MSDQERILVIDDSEIVLARIHQALAAAGYAVITTAQVVGSARHLRNCDLVIVDFHMPGFDGGSVLSSLKAALPEGDGPLFYLYSTDARVSTQHAQLGFDGCFTQKGDIAALIPQVHAALQLRRMLKMRRARKQREH